MIGKETRRGVTSGHHEESGRVTTHKGIRKRTVKRGLLKKDG